MKRFDQTRFFKLLAPWLTNLLPNVPTRSYICRILLAILVTQCIAASTTLAQNFLDNPTDYTWQYYTFLLLEAIRYGTWFWSVWYGLTQVFKLISRPSSKRIFTPESASFGISFGFLLFMVDAVSSVSDQTYASTIRFLLITAFCISVLLPMVLTEVQPTHLREE